MKFKEVRTITIFVLVANLCVSGLSLSLESTSIPKGEESGSSDGEDEVPPGPDKDAGAPVSWHERSSELCEDVKFN